MYYNTYYLLHKTTGSFSTTSNQSYRMCYSHIRDDLCDVVVEGYTLLPQV